MFVRPPFLLKQLYPKFIWRLPEINNTVYLTFDDGPDPEVTNWVLDILEYYNIKATFFCVGENVKKYPEIFERIKKNEHLTGNHTYNHLSGWSSNTKLYLQNIHKAQGYIQSNLFRPPYGKITYKQAREIKKNFKIIMWDVVSYDYKDLISPQQCLKNVLQYTRNGSIIVFHDSQKAKDNLKYVLPLSIEELLKHNFKFNVLQ